MYKNVLVLASTCVMGAFIFATPSAALSMSECSAKYKAAQADGSAKDMQWNDFRKAQCGSDTAQDSAAAKPAANVAAKPAAVAPEGVTFPSAISSKYASETPSKARMHTCRDSYKDNKTANTLSGLKWIQKGGGYYSICNAKLKG